MAHFGFVGQRKQVLIDLVLGQGADRQGRHEFRAGFGKDRPRLYALLGEQADQQQRFVGGDAAANDQQNPARRRGKR